MKKTVIFGGTFNPVHIGHEVMMKAAAEYENTKEIIIMPDNIPPHKQVGGDFAAAEHRLNMCRLAATGIKGAAVSDYETSKPGKSYTVDTLSELCLLYPEKSFAFVIGGDMLMSFDTWYRYGDILKMCSLLVFRRTENGQEFDKKVEFLQALGAEITVLEVQVPKVSSTEIRRRMLEGASCDGLVSPKVLDYILQNNLYKCAGDN